MAKEVNTSYGSAESHGKNTRRGSTYKERMDTEVREILRAQRGGLAKRMLKLFSKLWPSKRDRNE